MDGIILVNKEKNYTSRDVVNIISGILKTKKVGHTGTLDPLATGVLVICINKATKLVELLTQDEKEYIAEVTLGTKTDTLDITGQVLEDKTVIKSEEEIKEALNEMIGTYDQEVPIYSAIKVNGRKLYEYAREKEEVILPKKQVTIKKLELIDKVRYDNNKTIFKIKCLVSKGTYIRSLVRDIATKLDTIGVMSSLTRTKQGIFKIEDCYSIEDIKLGNYKITDIKESLNNYYQVEVDDDLYKKVINGQIIPNTYKEEYVLFLKNNQPVCLYKENKDNLKLYKMF